MFGTSGLLERDLDTLVTEEFTVSWPKYYSVGKCFYNTNFEFDGSYSGNKCLHHLLWTKYKGVNIPPVNVQDKVCFDNFNCAKGNIHSMQLNHYFTKSFKEYGMKKRRVMYISKSIHMMKSIFIFTKWRILQQIILLISF